jgi:DNA replication and repair protein RecF
MGWSLIKGEGVRNLQPFKIEPSTKLSFFWGDNGAGKTSLLEAVCFLSTGRSFRGRSPDSFINAELALSTLFGEWANKQNTYRIGIQRDRHNHLINQINGAKQKNLAVNNDLLAVKVLTPDIFSVVAGKADQRRNLLDWPLFHVEHVFRKAKTDVNRVLKQRNASLRMAKHKGLTAQIKEQIKGWDLQLVQLSQTLHQFRKSAAERLQNNLCSLQGEPGVWISKQKLTVRYQAGWPKAKELADVLIANLEKDVQKGYTQAGPHRFDLTLYTDNQATAEVFSRGELKTLAVASQLCQIERLVEEKQQVVVLLDDLFAELDSNHSTWCLEQLNQLTGVQSFITGITIPKAIKQRFSGKGTGWFHVEHGRITAEENNL